MTRAGAPTPPTKDYLAEMKRCTYCQKLKDKSEFYSSGGKLKAWCKPCWRAQVGGYKNQKRKGQKTVVEPKAKRNRKTCTKCKERKALSKFNRSGLQVHSWCKLCQNANTRRQRRETAERVRVAKTLAKELFEREARGKAAFEFVIGLTKFQCFPQDSEYKTMIIPLNNEDEATSIFMPLEKLWALGDWIAKEKKARTEL